jgi:oligoribonuclease (3'-5' exoribonuclease)
MNEWCKEHHNAVRTLPELNVPIEQIFISMQSGLTAACLTSKHTTASVQREIMKYIKKWIPQQRSAMLAGNSVHADKVFLAREMPEIVDWLHYRSLDYPSPRLTLTDYLTCSLCHL